MKLPSPSGRRMPEVRVVQLLILGRISRYRARLNGPYLDMSDNPTTVLETGGRQRTVVFERDLLDFWRESSRGLVYPSFVHLKDASDADICRWVNRHGLPVDFSPGVQSTIQSCWPDLPGIHCAEIRRQARLLHNFERGSKAVLGTGPEGANPNQTLIDAVAAIHADFDLVNRPAMRDMPRWRFSTLVSPAAPQTNYGRLVYPRGGRPPEPEGSRADFHTILLEMQREYGWESGRGMRWHGHLGAGRPHIPLPIPVALVGTNDPLRCLYLEMSYALWQSLLPDGPALRPRCWNCGQQIRVFKADGLCGTCRRQMNDRLRKARDRAEKRVPRGHREPTGRNHKVPRHQPSQSTSGRSGVEDAQAFPKRAARVAERRKILRVGRGSRPGCG